MSMITAQLLIGTGHQNHGGINPSFTLYLHENSRPAWELIKFKNEQKASKQNLVWIPTVENMLEDALLMIAVHVLKNEDIIGELSYLKDLERVEMYKDIPTEKLQKLYQLSREISKKYEYKIVLTILEGSSLGTQIKIFEQYDMDVEVCTMKYSRFYSKWAKEQIIKGNLAVII